jgi:putative protein kinase ArgK-like GTPase of G3E family
MDAFTDQELLKEIQSGNRQALAKAITTIENSTVGIEVDSVEPTAQVLGVTGAPGVGKSTTVDAIIKFLRKKNWSSYYSNS